MQIDEKIADSLIEQLSEIQPVLDQGRSYGIRVVVTRDAWNALLGSTNPKTEGILSNVVVLDEIPDVLKRSF